MQPWPGRPSCEFGQGGPRTASRNSWRMTRRSQAPCRRSRSRLRRKPRVAARSSSLSPVVHAHRRRWDIGNRRSWRPRWPKTLPGSPLAKRAAAVAVQPHLRSKSSRARNGQRQATVAITVGKLPFPLLAAPALTTRSPGPPLPARRRRSGKKKGPSRVSKTEPTSWAA